MPSQGARSSGTTTGRLLCSLAVILCAALPAAKASAQAHQPIPAALFNGPPDKGQSAKKPAKPAAKPANNRQHPAAVRPAAAKAHAASDAKPERTPTQTPFGVIYRTLGSDGFTQVTEPETAPLRPAETQPKASASAKPSLPADQAALKPQPAPPLAPEKTEASQPPAPPTSTDEPPSPAVTALTAPIPANVPLPPRAPANRGTASAQPVADAGANGVPNTVMAQAQNTTPQAAQLPPASSLSDRQIVERASRFFNTTETMQASFTQLGGNQRTTGTFYLERPGRMRFAYNPPSTLEIVSDGKNVAVRDSKLNTSDVYAINQTPLKFLLRDPINLGSDLKVLDVVRDPTSNQITLEDSSTIGGKAQITLFFDQQVQNLTRWTIVDAQGYTTTVILSRIQRTKRGGG